MAKNRTKFVRGDCYEAALEGAWSPGMIIF